MMLNNFLNNGSNLESKDMKHKQKPTKGGFKMKPTRFLIVAIVLLGMVATASAMTAANTVISNRATGTYEDALSNTYSATSNWIHTTVAQLPGLSFVGGSETLAQNIAAFGTTTYAVTIKNTGNGPDTYNLSALLGSVTGTGTFGIAITSDAGGTTPVAVSPSLAMNGEYTFYIVIDDQTATGATEETVHVADLTVTSDYAIDNGFSGITQTGDYTSKVQAATVNVISSSFKNASGTDPVPGDLLTMDMCFENDGSLAAHNVIYQVTLPSSVSFKSGSIISAGVPQDDDAIVNGEESEDNGYESSGTVTITIPTIAAGTSSVCISFQVVVVDDQTPGTTITLEPTVNYDDGDEGSYPVTTPTVPSVSTTQTWGVTLLHSGTIAYTGLPTTTWQYAFTVTNDGSHTDDFDLSVSNAGPDGSMVWAFYAVGDVGGTALTNSGSLARNGSVDLIAVGTITLGTDDGSVTVTTITATTTDTNSDPAANDSDTGTTTVTAPNIMLVKSSSQANEHETGENVIEVAPGNDITYTIVVQNWGSAVASSVVITDAIPANTTFKEFVTTTGTTAVYDENAPDVTFTFGSAIAAAADASTPTTHTLSFTVTVD